MDLEGSVVDVADFRRRAAGCPEHRPSVGRTCPKCVESLEEASSLWQGEFLQGFTLKDSVAFDDWQFFQSGKLRSEYGILLEKLTRSLAASGEVERAIPYAMQWSETDPLNEAAHSGLMRLYVRGGNRTAAIRQYRRCSRLLVEELGAAPSAALNRLYEEIKTTPAT